MLTVTCGPFGDSNKGQITAGNIKPKRQLWLSRTTSKLSQKYAWVHDVLAFIEKKNKMPNEKLRKIAQQSKRYPFIAEHRGGPLSIENHRKLINWAKECSAHVLHLIDTEIDQSLKYALHVAEEWEKGNLPTGEAMKASLSAHAVAKQTQDPVYKSVARAIGQAVATAHMADHSLGGAFYALKAVKLAQKNIEEERQWQTSKLNELPPDIIEIVQSMWEKKELDRRI